MQKKELLYILEEAYIDFFHEKEYKSIDEFIFDDKKCYSLIMHELKLNQNAEEALPKANLYRASHIMITFLLGYMIGRELHLLEGTDIFKKTPDCFDGKLWQLTAIAHDYGYFSKKLSKMEDLTTFCRPFDLLTDSYTENQLKCLNNFSQKYGVVLTHSYSTIKDYYKCKQELCEMNLLSSDEINDHGIVGGCLLFCKIAKVLCESNRDDMKNLIFYYKTACLIAAQHNIFKSSEEKFDLVYNNFENLKNLVSTSDYKVGKNNRLLFLLSIVDTIECVKRFSKKQNPKTYLQTKTILKKVKMEITESRIIIDFTNLYEFIKTRKENGELKKTLNKHCESIMNLNKWVTCSTCRNESNDNIIVIEFEH